MARTDTSHDAAKITRFYGLSTETKPENPMIGATFYETDTQDTYVFGDEWVIKRILTDAERATDQVTRGGQQRVWVTDEDGRELQAAILEQLKIMNAHLARINGEVLDETDIPVEEH